MKRTLCLPMLACCLCASSYIGAADAPQAQDPPIVRSLMNFVEQVKKNPQEKLYIHTDRSRYDARDTIWLRPYLLDAMSHLPSDYSNFVYVELVDRRDSVYSRVKIRRNLPDSTFAGYIPVPETIPQGEYFLRGYSYWMQNKGEGFLFRKPVLISNSMHNMVLTDVSYTKDGDENVANIHFLDRSNESYANTYVNCQLVVPGKKTREKLHKTDEDGRLSVPFSTADSVKQIKLSFTKSSAVKFERYIPIPSQLYDYDVQFLPEGGGLLAGCIQKIAFKAVRENGLAADVEGAIYDSQGEKVVDFRTVHKGMGTADFMVVAGEKYYAVARDGNGVEKRFDLPEVRDSGFAMQLLRRHDSVILKILKAQGTQYGDSLYFMAQTRGRIVALHAFKDESFIHVDTDGFPEGIAHFLLMDGEGGVLSQRLFFHCAKSGPEVEIVADKDAYGPRERVSLSLFSAESGSFSMSVTDADEVPDDSVSGDIMSELLLCSDLKGYIEEPGFYFSGEGKMKFVDLVMLTHGWTRFDIKEYLAGDSEAPKYYMERGQFVSGKVKTLWGKDASEAQLMLLGSDGTFSSAKADSAGNFVVDGISFQDGTKFIMQALSRTGKKRVEVLPDADNFLAPQTIEPYSETVKQAQDDFEEEINKPYYYENGEKVLVLGEVEVRARRQAKKRNSRYSTLMAYAMDSASIARTNAKTMDLLLMSLPGMSIDRQKNAVMRNGKPVILIVNDSPEDYISVSTYDVKGVMGMSYLSTNSATNYFTQFDIESSLSEFSGITANDIGGAIVIELDYMKAIPDRRPLNITTFTSLGYQRPAEFYVPRYDVDSVRQAMTDKADLRKTVYWNPCIPLVSNERKEVSFFTPDGAKRYRAVLEGICSDGAIVRKRFDF